MSNLNFKGIRTFIFKQCG